MRFTPIILLFLSATSGLMALPLTESDPAYVELYREKTSTGSLVYLGAPEGSPIVGREVPRLEERELCQKPQSITCDNDHTARNNVCDELVSELFANSGVSVGQSPRQICFMGDSADKNRFCCVSWNRVVKNLTKGDLSTAANSIMQQCTVNGISGTMDNTVLQDVCTTVCLSRRGTGCR